MRKTERKRTDATDHGALRGQDETEDGFGAGRRNSSFRHENAWRCDGKLLWQRNLQKVRRIF